MISITTRRGSVEKATSEIERNLGPLARVALVRVLGRAGAEFLRAHFASLQTSNPNQLGSAIGRRANFWAAVRRGVQNPQVDAGNTTALIAVVHPAIRQKLEGGTITAKKAGALTIPVTPKAYDLSPKEYEQKYGVKLVLLKSNKSRFAVLAEAVLSRGKGSVTDRLKGFTVAYVLKKSVYQKPFPETLPPTSKFAARLLEVAQSFYTQRVAAGGNPSK